MTMQNLIEHIDKTTLERIETLEQENRREIEILDKEKEKEISNLQKVLNENLAAKKKEFIKQAEIREEMKCKERRLFTKKQIFEETLKKAKEQAEEIVSPEKLRSLAEQEAKMAGITLTEAEESISKNRVVIEKGRLRVEVSVSELVDKIIEKKGDELTKILFPPVIGARGSDNV